MFFSQTLTSTTQSSSAIGPTLSSPTNPLLVVLSHSPNLVLQSSFPIRQVMDHRVSPPSHSLEESHRPSSRSATHLTRKPPQLRIVVPPTEYCPFSTDLTLPITSRSLPTPVSSSCFTFSDMRELISQGASVPPTPAPLFSSCSQDTPVARFASPTSSQFLLMPPTPHLENVGSEVAICISPPATPAAASEPMRSGSNGSKSGDLRPWEISSSTWLSDLGGHTETDRIFRRNLLEITSVDTGSSPASTPALSSSAVSPSSHIFSVLASNLPTSLARQSLSLSYNMSSQPSSPVRLALKPMGTDTFPSALDSLQAWRESVTPGILGSEEPRSPLSENVHGSQPGELEPETAIYPSLPSHQLHSHDPSPHLSHVLRSRTFIERAKTFGGRVKQLVRRQGASKHRGSMDRAVSFRQDSESGSVILITAPPPPYDIRPVTDITHGSAGQEYMRSRTTSEYSSAIQASTVEHVPAGMTDLGSRQGSGNRNALRRLSLAALSTIKRF